jgi:hypothetical protein
MEEEQRWDKLKSWVSVQQDIQARLQTPDKFDQSVSLHHGPQVLLFILLLKTYRGPYVSHSKAVYNIVKTVKSTWKISSHLHA